MFVWKSRGSEVLGNGGVEDHKDNQRNPEEDTDDTHKVALKSICANLQQDLICKSRDKIQGNKDHQRDPEEDTDDTHKVALKVCANVQQDLINSKSGDSG